MPPRHTHRNPASVLPPRVAFGWKGSHPLFPLKSSPCSARVFTPLLGAERQPLSASAIGAALHFPSASALEARTPVSFYASQCRRNYLFYRPPLLCRLKISLRVPFSATDVETHSSTRIRDVHTTHAFQCSRDELTPCVREGRQHHLLYFPLPDLGFSG